jgi:hypothetical protein
MSYRVLLPTTEPYEAGLLDYLRCHSVARQIEESTTNTGFEEYWYSHPDRAVLAAMIAEFWFGSMDDFVIVEYDQGALRALVVACENLAAAPTGIDVINRLAELRPLIPAARAALKGQV